MNKSELWKNFNLGTELDISGRFIFNGLQCLHEMKTLHYGEEVFEFLYNVSVGLERLFKVTIVLIEHDDKTNQEEFEKSLITHNHLELLSRIQKKNKLKIGKVHLSFLEMLGQFYKTHRYDRYSLISSEERDKEKKSLHTFIEHNYDIKISDNFPFDITFIDMKLKKFIGKVIGKISKSLYEVLKNETTRLNIYTDEIRYDTKASKIFVREEYNFENEDILLKELLIFFINSKQNGDHIDFIRNIKPLDFDMGLEGSYLECMNSLEKKLEIMEELETLYEGIENPRDRINTLNLLGDSSVCFNPEDDGDK